MMRLLGGKTLPWVTSAPAATMLPAPITAPFMTMAPMPMRAPSSTVQPCSMAPWPTVTLLPMVQGKSASTCTQLFS